MKKLHQVEEARALMEWSVFHWLFEKRLVRETADQANAALDKLNRSLKTRWSGEAKAAFKELSGRTNGAATLPQIKSALPTVNPEVTLLLKKVKEADDAARRARTDAENTFDEAERLLNTDLARQGCEKAIHQWQLDEKAIRKAEAVLAAEQAEIKDSVTL